MRPIVVRKGWVKEWEYDSAFTIVIETENEEDRKALLETMRDNKGLKITIEEESNDMGRNQRRDTDL